MLDKHPVDNKPADWQHNKTGDLVKGNTFEDLPWISQGVPLDQKHDYPAKPPQEVPVEQPKEMPATPQEISHYHSQDTQDIS